MSRPVDEVTTTSAGPRGLGPDEDGKPTVFISYSRRDMAFVDRLDAALQAHGVSTLVDRAAIEVGEPWRKRLEDLIARAETVVFVLSPYSVRSKICAEEVDFGKRLGKRFIPVVARPVDNPSVPETLSELNYVHLDDESAYEANLDRLVRAIGTDLAWMRMHADLGRVADEWSRARRPRGLLLGATRLKSAEDWIAHRPANAPLPTDDTRDFIAASRRAARQWRNGILAALVFGLVLSLGLAAAALLQRREALAQRSEAIEQRRQAIEQRTIAERQTVLAVAREREAQVQREAAERNFDIAKSTIDAVIRDLAEGLRRVDGIRVSVLRTVLSRVETAMGRLTQAAPHDVGIQFSRSGMLLEFADTYLSAGERQAAERSYAAALEIARALSARAPDDATPRRFISVILNRIGASKLVEGHEDLPGAIAAYEESVGIARDLARREPGREEPRHDLSISLVGLGDARRQAGDSRALAAYEECSRILAELLTREPRNIAWLRDRAVCLNGVGLTKYRSADRAGALAAYRQALAGFRTLTEREPDDTNARRDLLISLTRIADLLSEAGDLRDARALYGEALDVARNLAGRDVGNTLWQRDLLVSIFKVISIGADPKRRLELLQEAIPVFRRLEQKGQVSVTEKAWFEQQFRAEPRRR